MSCGTGRSAGLTSRPGALPLRWVQSAFITAAGIATGAARLGEAAGASSGRIGMRSPGSGAFLSWQADSATSATRRAPKRGRRASRLSTVGRLVGGDAVDGAGSGGGGPGLRHRRDRAAGGDDELAGTAQQRLGRRRLGEDRLQVGDGAVLVALSRAASAPAARARAAGRARRAGRGSRASPRARRRPSRRRAPSPARARRARGRAAAPRRRRRPWRGAPRPPRSRRTSRGCRPRRGARPRRRRAWPPRRRRARRRAPSGRSGRGRRASRRRRRRRSRAWRSFIHSLTAAPPTRSTTMAAISQP